MGISQKDMINSLSYLLNWLEQENSWGTNKGELKFITGRIGELYTAIMTNGQMAEKTNQKGYDVVSEENENISVKTTTCWVSDHQFKFTKSTLNNVNRVVLVYVDIEEISVKIIYDKPLNTAKKLMVDAENGKKKAISMSKVISLNQKQIKKSVVKNSAIHKDYTINRLESGTIELFEKKKAIKPVKPALRKIAKEVGVDINNSKSNQKTTRVLGWDIIRQLNI